MLKTSLKTAVVTATVMALGSTGAFAELPGGKPAKIKEYVYDVESAETAILHVTSSDGTKWDDLKSGMLPFSAHMKIDTRWPGAINKVAVVLGNCSGSYCKSFPLLWSHNVDARDYDDHRIFSVAADLLENGTAGLALERQNIIDTCNQHLAADGATKKHESSTACRRPSWPRPTGWFSHQLAKLVLRNLPIHYTSITRSPAISRSRWFAIRTYRARRSVACKWKRATSR